MEKEQEKSCSPLPALLRGSRLRPGGGRRQRQRHLRREPRRLARTAHGHGIEPEESVGAGAEDAEERKTRGKPLREGGMRLRVAKTDSFLPFPDGGGTYEPSRHFLLTV